MSLAALFFAVFGLPPMVVVCYFLGITILLIGLVVAFRRDMPRARGLDKWICLGPVLYAAPLAVFAGEHFTATRAMSGMVPHWIPWHFFWVLFVGVSLVAAALALATGRVAALAAAMLGVMFLLFVALMDVPFGVVAEPRSRFTWALMLRELSFSLCSFALAAAMARTSPGGARWRPAGELVAAIARVVVGATLVFYGVEHFLHPQHVPVIPLELLLPAWMPLHLLIGCGTGAALIVTGAAMVVNRYARTALTLFGVVAIGLVLVVYGPILATKFSDVGTNLNYFADTLCYAGALLMLAGSIAPEQRARAAAPAPVIAGERVA
ncbi:MAG TPA: hypothetical protein VIY53_16705 [Acidobacteriaceae bacterium]